MRNADLAKFDRVDRPVLAIGTDYPPGHLLPAHRHRRAQFLYGATGIMRVETADGSWTVPTRRAVLIPPETGHQVLMDGLSTRSLYLEPAAVPWFPDRCRVVEVSPLLRELLLSAVDLPAEYDEHGRDGALASLILHEIRSLAPLPFDLPLPARPELRALCAAFRDAPDVRETPGSWADRLNVSVRTVNRMFAAETGMSFQRWRQRACVLQALRLLTRGATVTEVASALGYETPAAFSVMFTRHTGATPSSFRPR